MMNGQIVYGKFILADRAMLIFPPVCIHDLMVMANGGTGMLNLLFAMVVYDMCRLVNKRKDEYTQQEKDNMPGFTVQILFF